MTVALEDINRIAHLAKLAMSEPEANALNKNFDKILTLVERMNTIDTDKILPLAHPLEQTQPLRADEVTQGNERELLLQNAPDAKAGLFIVPQVIETPET